MAAASVTQAAAAGAPPSAKYSSANRSHTRRRSSGPRPPEPPAPGEPTLEAAELNARSTRDAAREFACREPETFHYYNNKDKYYILVSIKLPQLNV